MPLPSLTLIPPRPAILNRTQAAARLGLNGSGVDKMIRAGMLTWPIRSDAIDRLSGRGHLGATAGELTVLRTDARAEADRAKYPMDTRAWVGFHVEHTDEELGEASLRWWRCDPERVIDNELFAVTVATYPVAVYRMLGETQTIVRPDETTPRHHLIGQLLARVVPGMDIRYVEDSPKHLKAPTRQIMSSRVTVQSGGPIGYLQSSA